MMLNLTHALRKHLTFRSLCAFASVLLVSSLGLLSAAAQVNTEYSMTVEEYVVHTDGDLAGQTTYRFYINMINESDFLSSIYGNDGAPLYISTSDGFFNEPFASGSTAGGINSLFVGLVPTLAFDSWVTIGIESAPTPPNTDVGSVESIDQPWLGCFNAGSPLSGTNVVMDDFTGGAWYLLNGAANGLPDPTTMRVLFLQLTLSGTVSGTINAQVFPQGVGSNQVQLSYSFDGAGESTALVDGCTDVAACNFNADATSDDGTCTYPDAGYTCDGECVNDSDLDGVCDEFEVAGCQDMSACNYDLAATDDDGSCVYPDAGLDCDGNCLNDSDMDGVCDENEVVGCTDDTACNYDATATDDSGACTFPDAYYDCAGDCLNDTDGDGTCDELELEGCTDDLACNYSPNAIDDDGSCSYPDAGYDCDGNCLEDVDMDGVCDANDLCADLTACNYMDNDGDCVYADSGYDCDGNCLNDADSDSICDEFEVEGCQDAEACNYDGSATDAGDCVYAEAGYDCDGACLFDADGDGVCDGFEVDGCTDPMACNFDEVATEDDGTCVEPEAGYDCDGACLNDSDGDGICDFAEIGGCTDGMACNYDSTATDDDGSCGYPDAGYDCNGECLSDADMDGVCDEFEVAGCQDNTACNYDEMATDEGDCTFPESGYDCAGACLNDADMDGVCDEFEVVGCQDDTACNYDENATDAGDCTYPEAGYDCNGTCLNDADLDGVCDEFEVTGCTDETAANYDPAATDDDGSCIACDLVAQYALSNVSCAGGADGFVDVLVTDNIGDAGSFTYSLDGNEQADAMFGDLSAGTYTIVAVAENGCSVSIEVTVEEPAPLTIVVDAIGDETEAGAGSIEITVTGGTEPYVFVWTGPNDFTSADEDLTGLVAGTYDLTVYDDLQCSTTTTSEVDDVLSIDDVNGVTWTAYPNPASAFVWIELGADVSAAVIQATDLQGRFVMSQEAVVVNGLIQLSVANWSAGAYILNVSAGDQNWSTQVVIQN